MQGALSKLLYNAGLAVRLKPLIELLLPQYKKVKESRKCFLIKTPHKDQQHNCRTNKPHIGRPNSPKETLFYLRVTLLQLI